MPQSTKQEPNTPIERNEGQEIGGKVGKDVRKRRVTKIRQRNAELSEQWTKDPDQLSRRHHQFENMRDF